MENEKKMWIIGMVNKSLVKSGLEANFDYVLKMKLVEIIYLSMEKAEKELLKKVYLEGLQRVYDGEEDLGEYVEWIEEKLIK